MRKKLVDFHLWLGFTIGLLWALQGLSGALLVYHRELIRIGGPALTAGPLASLDMIKERAETAAAAPIKRIGVIDRSGDLLVADYEDEKGTLRSKLVDGPGARIVGEREVHPSTPKAGSIWQWIYRFHDSLTGGEHLEVFVAISGLILLLGVGAGLWIAWPKRRMWGMAFDFRRWKSLNQQLYGWHRGIGLIMGFLLLITVPCGVYIIFAGDLRPQLARVVPHILPYKAIPAARLPDQLIGPQAAYEAGLRHFPAASFVSVAMPSPKAPVYVVRLLQDAEPRGWAGLTTIVIDAASGRPLHVYDAVRAPWSNRITDALYTVHTGEIAGTLGRILVLLSGLSLPMLYVTGVWAWWRRYKRKSKSRLAQR